MEGERSGSVAASLERIAARDVPSLPPFRRHALDLKAVELTPQAGQQYDAVLLVTDESSFPYQAIHQAARLSRNAFRPRRLEGGPVIGA